MEKIIVESDNAVSRNIEQIGTLFPNCITETRGEDGKLKKAINFDTLRQMLSEDVIEGKESYEFTWVGKNQSIVEASRPIQKTLRPCPEESVNWDSTENLYIEGDNLQVLKLLQKAYLGKVKMIYIDPPYNTGKDLVYYDDYSRYSAEWDEKSGRIDTEGNRLFKNNDSNGRFHSDWCSMIYSRLLVARDLLKDDGIIFISIASEEIDNLRKIADEVFGVGNLLGELIWDLGTGTTAGHFTRGHEYILCYAKYKENVPNFANYNSDEKITHGALKKISSKNPASEITFPVGFEFEGDNAEFEGELGDAEKEYIVSGKMIFRDGKLAEPVTIRAGFAMKNQVEAFIEGDDVVYDTKGQVVKRFYFNNSGILFYEKEKSVINPRTVLSDLGSTKQGTKDVTDIFGEKVFDFPKPVSLIQYLIMLTTGKDDLIVDFFSGSATTAHSVMKLNSEDGGKRNFIMVQLDENLDETLKLVDKKETIKSAINFLDSINKPHLLSELGKERIRRAGKKINPLGIPDLDVGFRVLKLDDWNKKDVERTPADTNQADLLKFTDNLRDDRSDLDLLFGCLIDSGLELTKPITSEDIEGCTVYSYNEGWLVGCFAENVPESVIKQIAARKPRKAVFRDSSFADSPAKINVTEIFKMISPDTQLKVI